MAALREGTYGRATNGAGGAQHEDALRRRCAPRTWVERNGHRVAVIGRVRKAAVF